MKILLVVAAVIVAATMSAGCAAGFVKEFAPEAARMAEYLWYGDRHTLPPPSIEDFRKHREAARKAWKDDQLRGVP